MKKNIISVAVAASAALVAGQAAAQLATKPMFISPDGTGQALIFPYYNAENGNTTSMHIVNTTGKAKALKIRFREYKASYEVLDFNVFLSPYDHFSWTVAAHPEGKTDGAAIITRDNSCTYPALGSANYAPYEGGTTADGAVYQPFVNFEFAKGEDNGDARTLAGYAEVIEMGVPDSTDSLKWGKNATHGATGLPAGCAAIGALYGAGKAWENGGQTGFDAPIGGLYGLSYHLNVNDAAAFGIEPTVIDDFSAGSIHALAGSDNPNLGGGTTASLIVDPTDGAANTLEYTVTDPAVAGWLAVSSLMMSRDISNDVMTNDAVGAQTDWVMSFPTKHAHSNVATVAGVKLPFTDNYKQGKAGTAGSEALACEYVEITTYDREEKTVTPEKQPDFSPKPDIDVEYSSLCYEVSTLMWDNTAGALNGTLGAATASYTFEDGWAFVDMDQATYTAAATVAKAGGRTLTDDSNQVLEGLPVIGFMATKYANSTVIDGAMFAYGHVADHKTTTSLSD